MKSIIRGSDIANEFIGYLKEIVEDKAFKDELGKAGSIAAMIGLGLDIYKQAREKAKTDEEKTFSSLIQFTF